MPHYVTPTVVALLSLAAGMQLIAVGMQVLMNRRNVGYLLRSPFGTAAAMAKQWLARRGSRNPERNRKMKALWIAREASRIAICRYFNYPVSLTPSTKEICLLVLYAATLPASRAKSDGALLAWLVLLAIVVLAYYAFAAVGTLASLRWSQARYRLSYVFGTTLRTPACYLQYVRDLISAEVIPAESAKLAVQSDRLGWWTKHYWQVETHDERTQIGEIVRGVLLCVRMEHDLHRKSTSRNAALPQQVRPKTAIGLGSGQDQSPYLNTQEGLLLALPRELAWRLRLDPSFQSLIQAHISETSGSEEQRQALNKAVDYLHEQMLGKKPRRRAQK